MGMLRELSTRQGHGLGAALRSDRVTGALMNRHPAAQVRQIESGQPIPAVRGSDQDEKHLVLCNRKHRSIAESPVLGSEITGE